MRIPELYHYQKFDIDWLGQLLNRRAIRFSDPDAFNDPWDCKPWFDSQSVENVDFRTSHIEFFKRAGRRNFPNLTEAEHLERDAQLQNPDFLRSLIDKSSRDIAEEINKRYKVYSLTTDPQSILMWAHYADHHRGVCLQFSCKNIVFCSAMQVSYCDEYPVTCSP
jgi:hypothetical protein